jgi:UDP-N-acetylglucosamine 2-epimerase
MARAIAMEPSIEHKVVHSGQHYDHGMSGQFFEEFGIARPKYNLEVGSLTHNKMMAAIISKFDDVLQNELPDMVIVYGDTNTTAAGAIAAAKRNIPIAHVEAGLREHDKSIPEEINKLITDSVTDLFFTPTETGRRQLVSEGKHHHVYVTGDISLDLCKGNFDDEAILSRHGLMRQGYIFFTCHREANTTDAHRLSGIISGLENLHLPVIFAAHPRTLKALDYFGISMDQERIHLVPQLSFSATQVMIRNAHTVVTDSGGVIKEAYFHKVHGVIIDTQTEWVETVREGWNTLVGPDAEGIIHAVHHWQRPDIHTNALGGGQAGEMIVNEIVKYLHGSKK